MSCYSRFFFPWLCDVALASPAIGELRRDLLSHVHGDVLEIGFGTGLNLPHYPAHVQRLAAVEPNVGMWQRARGRCDRSAIRVERHTLCGEALPFSDQTFDCVVSTFTLCSIPDVTQALRELFRVLRPGGRFLFLEHGLSPDRRVALWQQRLNGVQRWLGDGCQLNRPMLELVRSQPFAVVDAVADYLVSVPKTHGYLYRGVATKSGAV